jgi:multimeric flavodoxin WrbA
MKIIGFSSGVTGRDSNVDRMVKTIMAKSGMDSEFIKLSDLTVSGCKGCVQLCAGPQECRYEDDLKPYYHKIKDADAVVVGAPVYFGKPNTIMMSFLERFFGYRHVESAISGKPFVAAISGGMEAEAAKTELINYLNYFDVNVVDAVAYSSSVVPCFSCGRHKVCNIGGLYLMMGDAAHSLKITPDMFQTWESNPDAPDAIDKAAEKLRHIASND